MGWPGCPPGVDARSAQGRKEAGGFSDQQAGEENPPKEKMTGNGPAEFRAARPPIRCKLVPDERFELPTNGLQNRMTAWKISYLAQPCGAGVAGHFPSSRA